MNCQIISSLSFFRRFIYNEMFVYLLTASSNTNKYLESTMEKQLHKFVISEWQEVIYHSRAHWFTPGF